MTAVAITRFTLYPSLASSFLLACVEVLSQSKLRTNAVLRHRGELCSREEQLPMREGVTYSSTRDLPVTVYSSSRDSQAAQSDILFRSFGRSLC